MAGNDLSFKISMDTRTWSRDIAKVTSGLDALRGTMKAFPIGKVVVSQRRKIRGEKAKPMHGKAIANFLRAKGHDPFEYPGALMLEVNSFLTDEIQEILEDSFRTGRPQNQRARVLIIAAVKELADWARSNIIRGGLGQKTVSGKAENFYRRMRNKVQRGVFTSKYGFPLPRGIASGRFVEGIRHLPRK